MVNGLAASIFGPEYFGAQSIDLGIYEAAAGHQPVDIMIGHHSILPIGGYAIRYVTGEYMLVGSGGVSHVGGHEGLRVRWHIKSGDWVTTEFPDVPVGEYRFSAGWNVDELLYCELTEPGRIQLVPPAGRHGIVSLRVIQVIPSHAPVPSQPN